VARGRLVPVPWPEPGGPQPARAPQGGERVRGKANIITFRSAYPARQQFEVPRITGCHDLWVNEYTILYDGKPVMTRPSAPA